MWKILVIDDNEANRELLIEILREYAVCDTAVNGLDAFIKYRAMVLNGTPYDGILCDIEMPEIDGLQFLTMVREDEAKMKIDRIDGIPIIMVTAHKEPFMDAFKRGCDDYVLKPVNPAQLLIKIRAKVCWRETRDDMKYS